MNKSIVFFDSTTNLINPKDDNFKDKILVELFITEDKSIDEVLTKTISKNLLVDEYINIIIPVCFGKILSNFLGLRFATHIRCTPGVNQHANIFLYSFTGIQDYYTNECFNIIRTKGVFLIDYNIETILKSFNIDINYLSKENLVNEIKKLKIDVPLNYEDNHSIANEWSIYRWANTINTTDKEITKIEGKLENDLYFKYLKTINPISDFQTLGSDELQLNFEGNPTILYIDDEAEKGWKEIFEKIIIDENNIEFIHLDDEFNEKSKKEIVEISLNEVIKEKVDLVILDFRLHKEDFDNIPIKDVTGYQILREIKKYNKGIQVIIFSATNKVWNLQALLEAGADGFALKESIVNSADSNFTKQSVLTFKNTIEIVLERKFLKNIYSLLDPIIKRVELNIIKKPKNYNLKIQQSKLDNYLEYLKSADLLLYSNPNNLKYCFLQLILVIEDIIKEFYVESRDQKQYVDVSIYEKVLCLEKDVDKIKLNLKPIKGLDKFIESEHTIYKEEDYFKLFNNQGDRIPFNYRLHSVLYFKYKIDLEKASKYSSLYRLRSKSVAHLGGTKVKEIDILNSLELLEILI